MKTSKLRGAELRRMIGIQFFAEGGDGAGGAELGAADPQPEGSAEFMDTAAEPDGAEESELEAFFGDGSLFGDENGDGQPEGAPEGGDGEGDAEPGAAVQEPTYPVTIGGETVQLTAAQMAERLAAGQAPVQNQLAALVQQQLAQNPAMQMMERRASAAGMTLDQFVTAMQQQEQQAEVQQLMQQTGLSQELAQELAESRAFRQRMEEQERQAAQQKDQEQAQQKVFAAFMDSFPGVAADTIPNEVWQKVESGMDLTAAYAVHRVKELETQVKTLQQNANVRKKALGSARGEEQSGGRDPVLDGLNGKLW